MWKVLSALILTIICSGGMVACMNESSADTKKTAMVDVRAIIQSGQHAQAAQKHMKEAQEIYQYNLNVIEKELNTYKNKAQARAYLVEAARQLQVQFNTSKTLTTQSLLNTVSKVLEGQKGVYDLIVSKDGIIHPRAGDGADASTFDALPEDITAKVQAIYAGSAVTFPPLPKVVEKPNLPADLGEGVPFPPQAEKGAEQSATENTETAPAESKSKDEKAKGKKEQ